MESRSREGMKQFLEVVRPIVQSTMQSRW